MKYQLTVFALKPGEPARFVFSNELDSDNEVALKEALVDFCRGSEKVTNSKRIIVLDVNEKEAEVYIEGPGKQAPRNGRFAGPCEPGQQFSSAQEASAYLGFNNNEVAQFLSKIRRQFPDDKDAGQRTARVRGVTLIYDADHALSYRD